MAIAAFNQKNRAVSDQHLTRIFADVGIRYGYEDVEAEFALLKDFKVNLLFLGHLPPALIARSNIVSCGQ